MKKLLCSFLTIISLNAFGQEKIHTNTVIQESGSIYFLNNDYTLTGTSLKLGDKEDSRTIELVPVSDRKSGGIRTRVFKSKDGSDEYEIIDADNCYIINWYGIIFKNEPKKYLSRYDENCIPKKLRKLLKNQRMYLGKPYKW
ncbi:hypothetical protein [Edaphocola aurantiacus]|uniref:hypothetical protein n=1 Tax=Edaphocola aurantiacus TaxID=2601682 RepID=UPI001C957E87|nr:hypothetical protein [Edaphocola aurantiacus]